MDPRAEDLADELEALARLGHATNRLDELTRGFNGKLADAWRDGFLYGLVFGAAAAAAVTVLVMQLAKLPGW